MLRFSFSFSEWLLTKQAKLRWLMIASLIFYIHSLTMVLSKEEIELRVESWRIEDKKAWREKIIPAFEKKHPNIKLIFRPTAATEYDSALNAKLENGTAGDLIICRPFDVSLKLYWRGHLARLNDLEGMDNFPKLAKAAWSTDDQKDSFCVPIASVIHGFIYNKRIINELDLQEPETEEDFFNILETIKAKSKYIPLAIGLSDQWELATVGYQNIGPNYWKGEDGRLKLINGKQKLTDPEWVKPLETLEKWGDYMGRSYKVQTYEDSINLFTEQEAAIFPAGSWEISKFLQKNRFEMGAFYPPVIKKGDQCYISDHVDIGIGVNNASKHKKEALKALQWFTSEEFAQIYASSLPGFFSLSNHHVKVAEPLAAEFLSWREQCKSTIRSTYHILSRGFPNLEHELWRSVANIVSGQEKPSEAANRMQMQLESWYEPQQNY